MLGRMQVETDDIGGLGLEVGIIGRHVAIHAVRPGSGASSKPGPPSCDGFRVSCPTDGCSSAWARASVGFFRGVVQNPGLHAGGENGHGPSLVARVQSRERRPSNTVLPLADDFSATSRPSCKEKEHSRDAGVLGPTSPNRTRRSSSLRSAFLAPRAGSSCPPI